MFIPLNYTDTEVGTGDKFSGCKYIYSKISKKKRSHKKNPPGLRRTGHTATCGNDARRQ